MKSRPAPTWHRCSNCGQRFDLNAPYFGQQPDTKPCQRVRDPWVGDGPAACGLMREVPVQQQGLFGGGE